MQDAQSKILFFWCTCAIGTALNHLLIILLNRKIISIRPIFGCKTVLKKVAEILASTVPQIPMIVIQRPLPAGHRGIILCPPALPIATASPNPHGSQPSTVRHPPACLQPVAPVCLQPAAPPPVSSLQHLLLSCHHTQAAMASSRTTAPSSAGKRGCCPIFERTLCRRHLQLL